VSPARPRGGAAAAPDGGILASTALLAALGLVMIYSATAPLAMGSPVPPHLLRHGAALLLGVLLLVGALRVPLAWWQRFALPLWVASTLLLATTLLIGIEANGARRWLPVPGLGLSFQPAELAKWATPLAVAAVLARGHPESRRTLRAALLLTALPCALLLLQPDLGSAGVLAVLVGLLLSVVAVPLKRLAALAMLAGAGLVAYVALRPYALARWKGFLAPWQNARAEGFQLVQSFVAFGRGGSFGVGLGDGRQKLSYLPEAHTDFILAVVAEEIGLVGVLVVLGAFAALLLSGLRVARRAQEPFPALVAFAMTTFVTVPAAVNAGVVMGLLPTTGFTLPFLSFGSNSLIVCCLAVGILLRISSCEAAPGGGAPGWRKR
jgi:cell division protein FtsW